MALQNPFIGYTDRSYLQIKQAILAKIQNPNPAIGLPEITDHNETNPFIKRTGIWAGIAEMLGYYANNMAQESYIVTNRLYESSVKIAKRYDYRIRGKIPSTGQAVFTLNAISGSNVTIPIETEIQSTTGVVFLTTAALTIPAGQLSGTVNIKQWTKVASSNVGVSNGNPDQQFALNADIADNSLTVIVDGNTPYSPVDTFVLSSGTSDHYIAGMNEDQVMVILFGDGINGSIPASTKNIDAAWYETLGKAGDVGAGLITTINSTLTLPAGVSVTVNNPLPTTNGTDNETIVQLRKLIPLSLRTLYRAVTRTDYIHVTELAPGVAKAGIEHSCGRVVNIYIAPNGGGTASPTLINNTYNFLEDRKTITTKHNVYSAGEVIVKHQIDVYAKNYVLNATADADVRAALQAYYYVDNQTIGGDVYIGNIYQLLEALPSVDHIQVNVFSPIPFAKPITPSSPALNWTRDLTVNSQAATYRITFNTTTTFKVSRNNTYLGTFAVGTFVSLPDITFTINGTYTIGNKYEVKTYVYNSGTVGLNEPSLPIYDANYIFLNVTGGL